ncbi:hypothetical protein GCG54_00012313 [Colletotrichum gloeosporioides]|uniref:Ecp2 effector protein domain-containing protein n=1 Tax=Colletotrichum gloeosporioides TaxID=474922 RepID=A0A8H4FH60_COLGL|nr:uncharacterized protein GCG54_00012313 [Colletotrichum gloeosporioides]KAF3802067.1 hypothetical protein GCG54_00012313 [Colletotrichum gloeosporioides]
MKFFNTLQAFTLAIAGLAQALPDGWYEGTTLSNGTMEAKPLGASDSKLFTENSVSERLGRRSTSCWGSALDRAGTDAAVSAWKNKVGPTGAYALRSGSNPKAIWFIRRGAKVYYCINAPSSSGSLDLIDINHALKQMDTACPRYTAGNFRWDGSVEIFGKAAENIPICRG